MWITQEKLPLGEHIARYVEWLTQHGAGVFDAISLSLSGVISAFTSALLWFNPLALIAVFALLAYYIQRKASLTLFVTLSFLLIFNLGYWQETMETLAQVTFATLVCVVIGVPLGIVAAHRPWFYAALRPVLDLMQTVPTFVYLIPTLTLFGLGVVPGLISTVVFAIAAPIRLTYLGIRDVPDELMDAGKAFGCSRRQLLSRIELPHAMPSIAAGITQCIMLSLSMVVIAALVGADGLGKPVVNALNTADISMGFEAGLAIVLLAIILDRICKQREAVKRGDA
ncbi:choline ABC transporter permease subunit [Pseudomonas brassicacearum subsp. neoaurantiaca]|uniref:Putative Glycine betaine ABC transporter, permease component n=1 Tax=Pseudomonas brassicacearum (strain NFM421) TaxID=994484 RepID=F2KIV2_PSEBN|nr:MULTISPECIES: choline ABC transporter permease subunit [Pseudomonas]EIK66063.1 choline ABC transporter, permease protein [Pseudomonas fluorescens Q8r1-96]KIR16618.1 Glycine betaine transport system permease protein OpuAB [Pseudomonas fluorescens]AEA69978.1 putative Glycine betaine ABC transporter, permease component [Pseudomonas brassicacearum subsp. brassicacearum NFM421]AOS42293.1 choline ABC transporter permease subunit [Pseudomonas brassicacearum]KAB0524405.1 choline ABC transporter per